MDSSIVLGQFTTVFSSTPDGGLEISGDIGEEILDRDDLTDLRDFINRVLGEGEPDAIAPYVDNRDERTKALDRLLGS